MYSYGNSCVRSAQLEFPILVGCNWCTLPETNREGTWKDAETQKEASDHYFPSAMFGFWGSVVDPRLTPFWANSACSAKNTGARDVVREAGGRWMKVDGRGDYLMSPNSLQRFCVFTLIWGKVFHLIMCELFLNQPGIASTYLPFIYFRWCIVIFFSWGRVLIFALVSATIYDMQTWLTWNLGWIGKSYLWVSLKDRFTKANPKKTLDFQ